MNKLLVVQTCGTTSEISQQFKLWNQWLKQDSGYLLSIVVKTLAVGISYAIWAGTGIVLVAAINFIVLKQKLDFPALLGMFLIIAGVIIINLFSKSINH
ncbi:MAG: QacE family quaternary ammonium compound efflux SMR transporter [Acinetobacter sp.]|uniref:DMT family transporter n=1 Tax=Acinetobacter sp. TaxID=472 RepID=UPI000DB24E13|nr:MAG: QacE family quaternary ammonium compound efflux SMR transporter [Acinetobacter sp.]